MEVILGVLVSLVSQIIKKRQETREWESLAIVAILSLGSAVLFTVITNAGYWEAVQGILTTAGAFYAFIILRFPGASAEEK